MTKIKTTFRSVALTTLLLSGALAAHAAAPYGRTWSPDGARVAYRGFLPSPEGRYPRSAGSWIEVRVDNFTTEREARSIVAMYNDRDDRPLRRVLGSRDIGTVRIGDRRTQPLAAAWRTHDLGGEHLVLLVPRDPSVRELFPEDGYDRYSRTGYEREDRDDRYDRTDRYTRDGRGDRPDRDRDFERKYALLQIDLGGQDRRYGAGELWTATHLTPGVEGGFDFKDTGALPVRILHFEEIPTQ